MTIKSRTHFQLKRRDILAAVGAGAFCATALPAIVTSPTKKVVVIGGGMAGATVAKYLRLWSGRAVDVTIVEPSSTYVSNIMSNLVVTGQYAPTILNYNWTNLKTNYGVKVVQGTVTGVSPNGAGWDVAVSGSATALYADRVVVAPGIDFLPVPDSLGQPVNVLHAWKAGAQTTQLRDLLAKLNPGDNVVMTIPPAPYRCPPGPYERACVIADYLKRNKPGSMIYVLDANLDIMAEKENFSKAFSTMYSTNLSYLPGRTLKYITPLGADPTSGSVTVEVAGLLARETYGGKLLNIIPTQKAGQIAQNLGLCDSAGFAPVNSLSFESTVNGKSGIHVIGDAAKTSLPKAGHVGNQGAKICADAILRRFANLPVYDAPTANSACYSPLSNTVASWLTAVYQYDSAAGKYIARDLIAGTTGATEANGPSTDNFSKMSTWYKTLMTETFA